MYDWCRTNHARTHGAADMPKQAQAAARSTKAAQGHAAGADRRLGRHSEAPQPFKLKKFRNVPPRVCSFRGA